MMNKPAAFLINRPLAWRRDGGNNARRFMRRRRDTDGHACGNGPSIPVTQEELIILRRMAEGLPLDSIAQHMGLSSRTVRRRLRALCDRLGVAHPIQAIVWAARCGLV